MKKTTITDKDLFFLGLMYARGNFVGEREKVIAIYFRTNETEFIERVKKINRNYSHQKTVKINGDRTIIGLYFPSSMGERIKDLFKISKQTIRSRELPRIMADEKTLDPNFTRGLITFGIELKNSGFLFWKKKRIEIKEQSMIVLNKIGHLLIKNGIAFSIQDNSEAIYSLGGKKIVTPSVLTIGENYLFKFHEIIDPINPELDFLRASSS